MTAGHDRQLLDELLGPLHMHFLAAATAYRAYLENGKSFLFASSLRRTNASARRLLLSRGYLLPEALVADAVALLHHYDVWLTLWDELAGRAKPRPDDAFVFENRINFPGESQGRLEALYAQLRN